MRAHFPEQRLVIEPTWKRRKLGRKNRAAPGTRMAGSILLSSAEASYSKKGKSPGNEVAPTVAP